VDLEHAPDDVKAWSDYRLHHYFRFHLCRLFSQEDWNTLLAREKDPEWKYKHLVVDDDMEERMGELSIELPVGKANSWKTKLGGMDNIIDSNLPSLQEKAQKDDPAAATTVDSSEETDTRLPRLMPQKCAVLPRILKVWITCD